MDKDRFKGAPDTEEDRKIQQEILDEEAAQEEANRKQGGMDERDDRGGTSGGGQVERKPTLDEQDGDQGDS